MRRLFTACCTLFLAPCALAHEGHGHPENQGSLLHYLTEPLHAPLWIAAALLLAGLVRALRRRSSTA